MNNYFDEQDSYSTFDALVDYFKNLPHAPIKMIIPERYTSILKSASLLIDLLKETSSEGEINVELDPMFYSASISTILDDFTVEDPILFTDIIKEANNFEIYSLTNGKIKLAITFQSVFRAVA